MDFNEKIELIKDNLAEIIGEKELEDKIKSGKTLKIYWGTSPTGKPHIGYFLPLIKIAQLVKAGCEVTILFADLHAYLDAMKTSWELLELRTQYYERLIKQILIELDVDLNKIKFIKGSDYQLNKEYTIDVYKFMSKISVDSAQKGGAEVVKQSSNPTLSGLAYPLLQVLDEVYLDVDAELGGQDQRKIFMLSRDHIHKLGYSPVIHLMNPMIPSITAKTITTTESTEQDDKIQPDQILKDKYGIKTTSNLNKMSSSDLDSKIDFLEEPKSIKKKISKAFAEPTNISNTLFLFLRYVIFPINKLKSINKFIINRDEKYGGLIEYHCLESIQNDYSNNNLEPGDLKLGISDWLINFLIPIQEKLNTNEFNELVNKAY
jgi:tyrosyl-tRNA synthetase